jgi:hypothetical protein
MARYTLACAGLAVAIALSGCREDRTLLSPGGHWQDLSGLCQENPWLCVPVDGTIHDGTGNGAVAIVPEDPSPGADGIWLGNYRSARYCYANYNPFVNDQDHDWLDDDCEFELARAFAPVLAMSQTEHCPHGEPYWAATYFANSEYGWGEFVRIAYMPAYYDDCGTFSHRGDSEFMMFSVQYNPATQHWEIRDAFLSAHQGTPTESSSWPNRDGLQYPTRRYGYARVWVSQDKHGNYVSQSSCNDGALYSDTCDGNLSLGRIRVYPNRNVGSRFVDWMAAGVPSGNPAIRDTFVKEYFYTRVNFRGWYFSADGVTPYHDFLLGPMFNCFMYAAGNCYYGQGPTPPSWTRMTESSMVQPRLRWASRILGRAL